MRLFLFVQAPYYLPGMHTAILIYITLHLLRKQITFLT